MSVYPFEQYLSSPDETSTLKGVPMVLRDHPVIRTLVRGGGRVRYRGPRRIVRTPYGVHRDRHTLKENAVTFSVYLPT